MSMKVLAVILLLAALAMAFLAMVFGTRFAALLDRGQKRRGLPERSGGNATAAAWCSPCACAPYSA